jgi:hypothetical protein
MLRTIGKYQRWMPWMILGFSVLGCGVLFFPFFQIVNIVPLYNQANEYIGTTQMIHYLYFWEALVDHEFLIFGNVLVLLSIAPLLATIALALVLLLNQKVDRLFGYGLLSLCGLIGFVDIVFLLSGQIASSWGYGLGAIYAVISMFSATIYFTMFRKA